MREEPPVIGIRGDPSYRPLHDNETFANERGFGKAGISMGAAPSGRAGLSEPVGNFDAEYVTFKTDTSLFIVAHTLGRVVTRFVIVNKDGEVDVWRSSKAFTDSELYLVASVADVEVTLEVS